MKKIILIIYSYLLLLLSPFKTKTTIYSEKKLIDFVKNNRMSLIRFGDGEYRLMFSKKGIHYQEYDPKLGKELLSIFENYDKFKDKYIICIPPFFKNNIFWFLKNRIELAMCFAKPRLLFRIKQNKKEIYGDAFVFGKGKDDIYSSLWDEKEKIVLIHNDEKWVKIFNKKYNKKAIFIKTNSNDSYKIIDDIEKKVLNVKNIENYIVLVSSGPMAKVLAYRLSKRNIQVIDTGHFIDDPLV